MEETTFDVVLSSQREIYIIGRFISPFFFLPRIRMKTGFVNANRTYY